MKKRFYGYNLFNKPFNPKTGLSGEIAVLLNVPLDRFKKTPGCAVGNTYELDHSHIGKMFEVSILDPVQIGKCKYLGRGFNTVPESGFKTAIKKYEEHINCHNGFVVFETILNDQKVFIVVNEIWCDANPVKAKK